MPLDWTDHRADPVAWAQSLGCSVEACELLLDSDFIDLHNDLEVPVRLFGWSPHKRHGPWRSTQPFFGHTDYPRIREAGFSGVVYDIATNIFRPEKNRQTITVKNIQRAVARIGRHPEDLEVVRSYAGYVRARSHGRTAFWLSLQGGNALAADPSVLQGEVGQQLHRVTLVHLSSSVLGGSNSPSQADQGLTSRGVAFVKRCNAARVLVDLSHAGRRTFMEALEVHDGHLPPIVSHAGLAGVRPHWRNIDDEQARAIADRGGVVGVIYQGNFLARVPPGFAAPRAAVLDHLEHLIDVAGEASAAIGTDYDGFITPPSDLPDVTSHPLLVEDMLKRGWSETRIRGILGRNYLRVVERIRPGKPESDG
ncbi:MAG: dipeptidase [Myxococcota bacterium]